MKSKNFDKVKDYYDKGLWNEQRVWRAVGLWITPEEYKKITGETYFNVTEIPQEDVNGDA